MDRNFDLIIIGAGASGMTAAIRAGERNKHVLVLEKGPRPGRKILASGNGRCNLLNNRAPVYYGDSGFASEVLRHYPFQRIAGFLKRNGLMVTEESSGRFYPVSYQSATVLSMLQISVEINGAQMKMNTPVTSVTKDRNGFTVYAGNDERYNAAKVLVASGGAAQPRLGGSEDGYQILRRAGHTIVPVHPALVPLTTDAKSISGLSGTRIKCRVTLFDSRGPLHREEGEVLFTDYGISGICVMQCARFVKEDSYMELDFLYNVFDSFREAVNEMKRRQAVFHDLSPRYLLEGILSDKIAYAVMKQAGLPMRGETAAELTEQDLRTVVKTASAYRLKITGNRGFDYAQVSSGGAECGEFDPGTMESKLVPGFYAAGEVLNVDGDCGGFNMMFALASGLTAGDAV